MPSNNTERSKETNPAWYWHKTDTQTNRTGHSTQILNHTAIVTVKNQNAKSINQEKKAFSTNVFFKSGYPHVKDKTRSISLTLH